MNIVYCADNYWPSPGGAEVYIRNIAKLMAIKNNVTVITLNRSDEINIRRVDKSSNDSYLARVDREDNINVIDMSSAMLHSLFKTLGRMEKIALRMNKSRYHMIRSLFIHGRAFFLSNRVRAYLSGKDLVHTFSPWNMSHAVQVSRILIPHIITGFLHRGYWADDAYSVRLFRKCDHVIALSKAERDDYCHFGVPLPKISVIGVPSYIDDSVSINSVNWNWPFVLFLGVKRDYKGLDVLLGAAEHVWKVFPQIRFAFVGPRTDYSRNILNIYNDKRIIDIDSVSENEKWGYLDKCSFLCLPSKTEIMPNVILEAWLMKKAVITTDTPNLRELVDNCGLCVNRTSLDFAMAIIHLLANPLEAERMGRAGWIRCNLNNSSAVISDNLEALYRDIIR